MIGTRSLIILAIAAGVLTGAYLLGRRHQSASDQAAHNKALLAAVTAARVEENRRTAAQQEIAHDATKQAESARADAAAAGAVADRLRQQLATVRSASRPASAAGRASTGDPIGVLADVLERADRRAGDLAAYADAARIAGLACERSYDSLTTTPH
jgi:hypothetical protein